MPRRRSFKVSALLVGIIAASVFISNVPAEEPTDTPDINSIAFGNGIFVAVGDSGWVQHSSDGLEWTGQKLGNTRESENLQSVAFGNGIFLAASFVKDPDDGLLLINTFSSSDGQSWQRPPRLPVDDGLGSSDYIPATLTFGNDVFLLTAGIHLLISKDGTSWAYTHQNTYLSLFGGVPPVFGRNRFVVGEGGKFYVSKNGREWLDILDAAGISHSMRFLDYSGGRFYAYYVHHRPFGGDFWKTSSSATATKWDIVTGSVPPNIDRSSTSVWGNGTLVTLRGGILEATTAPPPAPVLFIEPDDAGVPTLWIECSPNVDWLLQMRSALDPTTQWENVSAFRTTEVVHSFPLQSVSDDPTSSLFRVIIASTE